MEFISIVIYLSIYFGLLATTFYVLSYIYYSKKEKILYSDDELPKVSVLIPAWNEEESIKETVKSVMKSNYPDFNVFIIDDGSTDNTLKLAKELENDYSNLTVFTKKNGGKASALNFGINKVDSEIIFSMDADTYVHPETMKKMARYFKDPKVMGSSPAMLIYNPKTILQRVQQVEFLMGLFLRRAFAGLDALFVTPGAFSAYRKSFFDKYGGYDEGNITEDLELALRIQFNGYRIENSPDAPAWTISPGKFFDVLKQRRRWYYGWIKNILIKYKKMISPRYGDLGLFVIPIAVLATLFSIIVTSYLLIKTTLNIRDEIFFLQNINFRFFDIFDFNIYFFERFFYLFFSNPIVIFLFFFVAILVIYLNYARKKIGKSPGLIINVPLFFMFFAILFGFWWIVSIFYALFYKEIKWR